MRVTGMKTKTRKWTHLRVTSRPLALSLLQSALAAVAPRRAEGLASLHVAGAQRRAALATYQMRITTKRRWTISTRIRILIWKWGNRVRCSSVKMTMTIRKRRPRAGGVEEAEQVLIVLEEEVLGVLGEWVGPGRCPRCPLEVGSFY